MLCSNVNTVSAIQSAHSNCVRHMNCRPCAGTRHVTPCDFTHVTDFAGRFDSLLRSGRCKCRACQTFLWLRITQLLCCARNTAGPSTATTRLPNEEDCDDVFWFSCLQEMYWVCGLLPTVAVLRTVVLFITGCCTLDTRVRNCVCKPDTRPISRTSGALFLLGLYKFMA
jgi:hypothetical protein